MQGGRAFQFRNRKCPSDESILTGRHRRNSRTSQPKPEGEGQGGRGTHLVRRKPGSRCQGNRVSASCLDKWKKKPAIERPEPVGDLLHLILLLPLVTPGVAGTSGFFILGRPIFLTPVFQRGVATAKPVGRWDGEAREAGRKHESTCSPG